MTAAERQDAIEALKLLMAHDAHWGDPQQCNEFGSLVHDDAVIIVDAGPRPSPEADRRAEIHGREAVIGGMSESLDGVHTAHQMLLPEIFVDEEWLANPTRSSWHPSVDP